MQIYNTAYDIASEYEIPFTNLNNNYNVIGFDFSLDMTDPAHANYRGSTKISRYIGTTLKEKYLLNDNRSNQLYATWQRNADYFQQFNYNQNLKECKDVDEYLKLLMNNQYYFPLVSVPAKILEEYNVDNKLTELSVELSPDTTIKCFNLGSLNRFKQLGSVMISLDKMNNVLINGNKIRINENEITLLIYDPVTDTIVDNVSYDFFNSVVIHQ